MGEALLKIIFDTNVILDVLLDRRPHALAASLLMVEVERRRLHGLVGATTVTTIHYLATRAIGATRAGRRVRDLLALFDVAAVCKAALNDALSLNFRDYEDAALHEAGRRAGATGIVTRDPGGFSRATLPVYAPDELLKMLRAAPPEPDM